MTSNSTSTRKRRFCRLSAEGSHVRNARQEFLDQHILVDATTIQQDPVFRVGRTAGYLKKKTLKEKERHRHKTIFHLNSPLIFRAELFVSGRVPISMVFPPRKSIPDISGCLGHVQHCCAEDGSILEDVLHLLNRHGFGDEGLFY